MEAGRTAFPSVAEQLERLTEGAVDVVTREDLARKLERSRVSGEPLVVKVGFDPTAPDIHLGHAVLLRKMRDFQECGHRVVFLIGDFTAMIGDPTGRSKTRPPLTRAEIEHNAETYRSQCHRLLDVERTEVRYNSEWLSALGSEGWIRLAARYNVARMLERNDFKQRFQSGRTIALHEFLYPLAQAYDSVALRADVELGGTDQLFNLNVGRDIMPDYGLEPQVVLTTPLLEGLDGVEKMSKSLGNYVAIADPPREIYGKLMSISDTLMWRYFELVTDVSLPGIDELRRLVEEGRLHPKQAKEGLALRIITDLHGEAAAREAREAFDRTFTRGGEPDDVPEVDAPVVDGKVFLPHLLHDAGLASSRSEATRLIRHGAVAVDGVRLPADTLELEAQPGDVRRFKVGKRRFIRVRFR
jgi:tyrosyl-tRNA synthetase